MDTRVLEDSKNHIKNVINIYSWFGTINMFVLVLTPVFEWTRRLPFNIWLPFDVNIESNFIYGSIYLYQIGCAIYAGVSWCFIHFINSLLKVEISLGLQYNGKHVRFCSYGLFKFLFSAVQITSQTLRL